MNCKKCGKSCEKEHCFRCKPRKPLAKTSGFSSVKLKKSSNEMNEFFLEIWKKRHHKCEVCKTYLGNEPRTYMFDHVLEKSKYPELKFKEQNIMLMCLECHDNKTRSNITEIVKNKIEEVRSLFNIL
jgi:5-methylcytosine-specific restriction endonuclease McrA